MKKKLMLIALSIGFSLAACNSEKADSENADKMNTYSDSTTLDTNSKDSTQANIMADSTTNAPADVNH